MSLVEIILVCLYRFTARFHIIKFCNYEWESIILTLFLEFNLDSINIQAYIP